MIFRRNTVTATMKVLEKSTAAPGLTYTTAPRPICGEYDLLIRVHKASICGTDLHIYQWDQWAQETIKPPLIIGHEFMGVVEQVGNKIDHFKVGDRVSGEGHITCGFCRNCRAGSKHLCRETMGIGIQRQGAFAEYLSFPASNAFKIPDEISDSEASIFDPYGNAVHATLSFDLVGEDVLITGAGPIGIMAVAIARHVGARHIVITDVNDYRLALAKKIAECHTLNPQKESLTSFTKKIGLTEGFDVGLEMSGNAQAFEQMIHHMRHGSRIASLGIFPDKISVDWSAVIFKSLTIKGIYGRQMYETWYKMIAMLQNKLKISPVITHHFPAKEFEKAFQVMSEGQSGKVVLQWT